MFNFKSRFTQGETTPKEFDTSPELNALRAKLENERMTRRQAMRKFGMAVMTVALLPNVDDLTRIVATKMSALTEDEKTAKAIARRFKHMGAAFATGTMDPNSPYFQADCQDRCDQALIGKLKGYFAPPDYDKISAALLACMQQFPGDGQAQMNCVIGKLKPNLPSSAVIKTGQFITCCYLLCDSNIEGTDPCMNNSGL